MTSQNNHLAQKTIEEVTAECNIIYSDGTMELCKHAPPGSIFQECGPGYGPHGECPKWNYYHRKASECTDFFLMPTACQGNVRICKVRPKECPYRYCETMVKYGVCPKGIKE